MRLFRCLGITLCLLSLTACVTTSDRPARSVDKQAALEANIKLGMAYLDKGNRDGALRSFAKALEFDQSSSEAHLGLALVHQLNGEAELAEEGFKKALKGRADFSQSTVLFSYGKFLLEQGRLQEALSYFDKVSKDFTYPSRAEALYFLGLTALQLKERQRAKGAFEFALNLNNKLGRPALELAAMFFEERDYPNAKKYLDEFAKNARHTPRSLWLGVRLERVFGNKDKEASYALALKNLHPYSQEYLEYKNLIEENK